MFLLTEEQEALRNEVHSFIDREIKPFAAEATASGELPRGLLEKVRASGFCALAFPEELGGSGYGPLEGLFFIEELSRALASLGYLYSATLFQVCYALKDALTPEQTREWLIPAIRGERILTLALTEPVGGSDAFAIDTIARRDGDFWVLNGSKCWITNTGAADAYIVAARTNEYSRSREVQLFYVDAATPGIYDGERIPTVGLSCVPTGYISFTDCRVPAHCLIGDSSDKTDGYRLVKRAINTGRLALCAIAVGLAQGALDAAVSFAQSREYFGRSIFTHQGVSFPLAEMQTNITVARNMLYHVADMLNAGLPFTTECAELKLFSSEMAVRACRTASEIHGAAGFDRRNDIARMLQDSLTLTTTVGTSQICKTIIAGSLHP